MKLTSGGFLLALALALVPSGVASAFTSITWQASGTAATDWDASTADWSAGLVPNYPTTAAYGVTFTSTSSSAQPIVDGDFGVGSINFSNSGWDITSAGSGDYLTLAGGSGGGIYNNASSGTNTIASNLVFSTADGTQGQQFASLTGSELDLTGAISGATSSSAAMSINSSSSDGGTVYLSGDNSFTADGITISYGTVKLGSATGLGATTNNVALRASTLDLYGNNITLGALTGYNYNTSGTVTNSNTGPAAVVTITGGTTTSSALPNYTGNNTSVGYTPLNFSGNVGVTFDFGSSANNYYGLVDNGTASTQSGTTTLKSGNLYVTSYGTSTASSSFGTGAISITGGSFNLQAAKALGYYGGTGVTVSGGSLTSATSATASTYYLSAPLTLSLSGAVSPGGTGNIVTFSLGAPSVAATNAFTMTGGTLDFDLTNTGTNDAIAASYFSISGGTLALSGTINYADKYQIFTVTTVASDSISGLAITGYDTTDYLASVDSTGDLSFTSAPEPSVWSMLIGGLGLLIVVPRVWRRLGLPRDRIS